MIRVNARPLPDHLSRTLQLVQRATKAGSALTYGQLRARLGYKSERQVIRAVSELCDRGLVSLDTSIRPTLVRPTAEASR